MSLSAADITDLRTALELLDQHGELAQTDVEADPVAELCGAYRHIGAGGTVARPTRIGPAMLFNTVKGHPGARVAIGVLSSRKRTALLLGTEPERLGWLLMDALQHLIQPTVIEGPAPCQEVVHRADDPGFDLRRLVPAPTNTPEALYPIRAWRFPGKRFCKRCGTTTITARTAPWIPMSKCCAATWANTATTS